MDSKYVKRNVFKYWNIFMYKIRRNVEMKTNLNAYKQKLFIYLNLICVLSIKRIQNKISKMKPIWQSTTQRSIREKSSKKIYTNFFCFFLRIKSKPMLFLIWIKFVPLFKWRISLKNKIIFCDIDPSLWPGHLYKNLDIYSIQMNKGIVIGTSPCNKCRWLLRINSCSE